MLDLLYAQAVRARRRWFERHPQARRRLSRPVISVGNLSVGGTGKTPLVIQVAQWLIDRGERPAILSRGYRRRNRLDGVVVVSDGTRVLSDTSTAGDEPMMLARAVPGAIVAVAEDRFLAGVLAERRLGASVHILDDGFQHVQLTRNLDVLMTTAGEIGGGRTFPFGRLRESVDAAARADVVVVLDADLAGARSEAWTLGISQACAARRVLVDGSRGTGGTGGAGRAGGAGRPGAADGLDEPRETVIAVAGIAHPDQFFGMLADAGYRVADRLAFPDHHRYDEADIARIVRAARAAGTNVVVTTQKDEVRLEAVAPFPFTCVAVAMTLDIDGWETLTASIEQALVRARGAV